MTAEIVIMNREAIALASDSAVTMSGETSQKIFTSANKLFALSKYHPVGIMFYGSAILMDIPWETITKIYRNKLGKNKFNTLKEYANDFIAFLDNGNLLFPVSMQKKYLRKSIYAYFEFIKKQIREEVRLNIEKKGGVTNKEIKQIVSGVIKKHYENFEKMDNVPSIPKDYIKGIRNKYGNIIDKAIKESFEELPISKSHSNQLKKIAASLFSKFPEGVQKTDSSGVVIAGFGEKDTFPSLESFIVEGIVNDKLKYESNISSKISFKNSAAIVPFAQHEMVSTFMEGVDPFYKKTEESYLSQIFNEYARIVVDSIKKYNDKEKKRLKEKLIMTGKEMLKDHGKRLDYIRKKTYISPITNVVSMLPKDELAAMAESLVNLTSFKRKITMESETVGGPIDVAIISKGDGFIWIKRKHYFKAELNPRFFTNYYKEM